MRGNQEYSFLKIKAFAWEYEKNEIFNSNILKTEWGTFKIIFTHKNNHAILYRDDIEIGNSHSAPALRYTAEHLITKQLMKYLKTVNVKFEVNENN